MTVGRATETPVSSAPKVVVLGGTGLLGTEIASAFAASGAVTRSVSRNRPDANHAWLLDGVEMAFGDVTDDEFLGEVLEGVNHVIYAIGGPVPAESNTDPIADVRLSLLPVLRVLEALRTLAGCDFTYLSSGGAVYGNLARLPATEDAECNPITSYGVLKLAAEKYVGLYTRLYGLRSRVLRISNAYGPLQRAGRGQGVIGAFLAAAQHGHTVSVFGDGSIVRDYVHVSDAARAVVSLASVEGEMLICNVGSGVGHSTTDVLKLVEQITGVELSISWESDRPFDVRAITLDTSRLRRLIDWEPIQLADGIVCTWCALS